MKIVIKCSDAPKEWCILEFQGTFDLGGKPLDGETIGTLTQNGSSATMMIGNHQLEGVVETLKKPLVVLNKKPGDAMDVDNESITDDSVSSTSYNVAGIIKKKILFADRPKTILKKDR